MELMNDVIDSAMQSQFNTSITGTTNKEQSVLAPNSR